MRLNRKPNETSFCAYVKTPDRDKYVYCNVRGSTFNQVKSTLHNIPAMFLTEGTQVLVVEQHKGQCAQLCWKKREGWTTVE